MDLRFADLSFESRSYTPFARQSGSNQNKPPPTALMGQAFPSTSAMLGASPVMLHQAD